MTRCTARWERRSRLLFFVYLAACVLLFGAEIAAEWPRVMYGHYDEEEDEEDGPTSLRERVRQVAARQLDA